MIMESKIEKLMSMAELKSMLSIYEDEYLVDFGDRYLAKIDNHDTNVVLFQWITVEEDEWRESARHEGQ